MKNKNYFLSIGVVNNDIEAALRIFKKKLQRNSQKSEDTIRAYPKRSEKRRLKRHLAEVRKFKEQSRARRRER